MRDGAERWCTGPPGDRTRYWVDDPTPVPGGQAYVYKANGPDGPMALKIVGKPREANAKKRARTQALAAHPHPRLRQPAERFRGPGLFKGDPPPDDECDLLVIASPWIEGTTLRAAGKLAPSEAMVVIEDVADAVAHLHDHGFVHRDVHPGNIVIGTDGHANLIDLGATRPVDDLETDIPGGVLGFIAPECATQRPDRRADRWCVGMVAVFALLGHPQGSRSTAQLEEELRMALDGTGHPVGAAALVCRMVATDPDDRPKDLRAWAAELRSLLEERPRRRWPLVAAAAVLVAATATGLAMASSDEGEEEALTPEAAVEGSVDSRVATTVITGADCGREFGVAGPGVDPAAVDASVEVMVDAAEGACATGPVERFGDALVQPVGVNGPDGVVVLSPEGHAARLTDVQYESWRQIAGMDEPENAIRYGGYPVSVATHEIPGTITVTLSRNGVLVGARSDTQFFWVPDQVRSVWQREGGADGPLGLPMTNVYLAPDGLRQDFEGGYLHVPASGEPAEETQPEDILVVYVEDRAEPLRGLGDLRGRIVRQVTGTAWLVDDDGKRRWIPDGATWECLGGDANVAIHDAPGWAVATLPLSAPATCDG